MNSNTTNDTIYRIVIDAPIETVWSELVKVDEVLPFFFGSVCKTTGELTIGAPFAMESPSGKYRSVVGKVLEFDPPKRYVHTFKFTAYEDTPCTVAYDLKEVDGGVEFTLTTSNVPAGTKTAKDMAQGGDLITQTLKSVVEAGRPKFSTRCLLAMIRLMEPFTPQSCSAERWTFANIDKL